MPCPFCIAFPFQCHQLASIGTGCEIAGSFRFLLLLNAAYFMHHWRLGLSRPVDKGC